MLGHYECQLVVVDLCAKLLQDPRGEHGFGL